MFRRNVTATHSAALTLAALERQTQGMLTANGAMIFRASQPTVETYSWGPSPITVRA